MFNIPKQVLEQMSPDEVARMVAIWREDLDWLDAWNKQRGPWQPPAPRWREVPPPRSIDDYGKIRTR